MTTTRHHAPRPRAAALALAALAATAAAVALWLRGDTAAAIATLVPVAAHAAPATQNAAFIAPLDGPPPKPFTNPRFSESTRRAIDHLNDLRRKPHWTTADVADVIAYTAHPIAFTGENWDDAPPRDAEHAVLVMRAAALAGERLYFNLPADPGGHDALRARLADMLAAPLWHTRLWAAAAAFEAGLNERPDVRARLLRLATDPTPILADAVRRKLQAEADFHARRAQAHALTAQRFPR